MDKGNKLGLNRACVIVHTVYKAYLRTQDHYLTVPKRNSNVNQHQFPSITYAFFVLERLRWEHNARRERLGKLGLLRRWFT